MAVRMRHDGVEQEIEVAEISVQTYERSGWKVVDRDLAADVDDTPAAPKGRRRETGEN
ncbi:hypothetical protein IMX12_13335 [Streptomyces sp. Babs14]|uniref:hypothetical protein n=1 Tax=unclassified Streptomyces TaxID=2593676 RepID=UPI001C20FD55|nr:MULTISPECIES: hypothetical protein [unclassified Streptomyces]MBU8549792.1 hypothetical protein [Streptomyces sp. Osf17]MBU8556575.1 hypothetical protein [Streptomyces sp. Babs14]